MPTWQEIQAAHQPTHVSTRIPLRADLIDEIQRLRGELRIAEEEDDRSNREPEAPDIAQRIIDLEAEARASEVEFRFRGVGRQTYSRMLSQHPPTRKQVEEAKENGLGTLEFNPETFPPALMAASAVEPTGVDWDELWNTWSVGQTNKLWRACLAANAGVSEVPKVPAAYAVMRGSERS